MHGWQTKGHITRNAQRQNETPDPRNDMLLLEGTIPLKHAAT